MAKLLETTLVPLIAVVLLAMASTAQSQIREAVFNYNFNAGDRPNTLTYQGDAHFPQDTTRLQLTYTELNGDAVRDSVGRVLHSAPFDFKYPGVWQADFATTVKFITRPNSGDSSPAEGLTFFVAPVGSRIPESSSGGNLGIFGADGNAPNLFAVEFDVNANVEWDPRGRHVGIDLGSRVSDTTTLIRDGLAGGEVTAEISYAAATKTIAVVVVAGAQTTEISRIYDLGNLLEDQIQVGLSASTGALVARHEIISWSFRTSLPPAASIRQVA